VRYGANSSYGFASSSNVWASSSPSHSITLHNLASSTTYHFQISSADVSGNRATSSDLIFTTLAPVLTVTFNKNGGDTEASPTTKTAANGGNVGSLPTPPTRTGYTFTSWNTIANGSGSTFTAATVVNTNITVYAQWTITSMTTCVWNSYGSTNMNLASNYWVSGGGTCPMDTTADLQFTGTSTVAATATANIKVGSITTVAGYTGN
jgi:uncharacterized repeat protein (TIGR02543 family)